MSKLALVAGLVFGLLCARTTQAQQTFNSTDEAHLVQSITFFPPQPPLLPNDFGSIDIVFANGVERLGVGLESGVLLLDENFGLPAFPPCGCLGFNDPNLNLVASRDYFVAYYLFQAIPNNPFGQTMDGLLIRQKGDIVCVNSIRRTTYPIDIVTVFDEHDCLRRIPIIGPSPAQIARLKRLIDDIKLPVDRLPPIKWPEPFCLTCPPWSKYEKQRAKFAQIHTAHVREELARVIKASKEMPELR